MVQEHSSEGPSEPGIDVRDLLYQLGRQKWTILGVLFAITGATAAVTLGLDKIYEGHAVGSHVDSLDGPSGNFMLAKEWYQTQNRIIASRTILQKVVDRLALHRDPGFMRIDKSDRTQWKGGTVEDAVDRLQKVLTVRQEKETRVVRIEVEDTSPEKAALIANTLADSYISWVMAERLGSTVSAVEWLSGQLDDISTRLEGSELALHQFRRTNNVLSVSLDDQQNVVSETIKRFSQALTEAQTRRIDVDAKLQELRNSNRKNPFDVFSTTVNLNPAIMALRKQYQEAVIERDSMMVKYGPSYPEMLQVQSKIDGLTAEARAEVDGLIVSTEAELREVDQIERGLRAAKQRAQNEGLELNLREIQYNQLDRQRTNNEKLHEILLQRTTETNLERMLRVAPVRVVDRATVMRTPVRPKFLLTTALGAFVGLAAGLGLAVLRTRMDRSIGGPDDVAAVRVNLLGLVPSIASDLTGAYSGAYAKRRAPRRRTGAGPVDKDLIVHSHPKSIVAECCRTIRTNLTFMSLGKPLKTLLVTSPGPAEGKTTMAVSLAITIAQSGRRTLIVDTDLRRPRVHKVFGLSLRDGVTSLLTGEAKIEDCVRQTQVDNLWVLPSGTIPPNPAELLQTDGFTKLVEQLKDRFDLVVLDSPPIGVVTDAAILGPQVDGVLVVVRCEQTTRDTLASAARQLKDVGAHLLGCVLNETDLSRRRTYKGYYYGGYYSSPDENGGGDAGGSGPTSGGSTSLQSSAFERA
jgi:succinoglycan biosynthesis transport protein ExoP